MFLAGCCLYWPSLAFRPVQEPSPGCGGQQLSERGKDLDAPRLIGSPVLVMDVEHALDLVAGDQGKVDDFFRCGDLAFSDHVEGGLELMGEIRDRMELAGRLPSP